MNDEYSNKIEEREKKAIECKQLFDLTLMHLVADGHDMLLEILQNFLTSMLMVIDKFKTSLEEKNK